MLVIDLVELVKWFEHEHLSLLVLAVEGIAMKIFRNLLHATLVLVMMSVFQRIAFGASGQFGVPVISVMARCVDID